MFLLQAIDKQSDLHVGPSLKKFVCDKTFTVAEVRSQSRRKCHTNSVCWRPASIALTCHDAPVFTQQSGADGKVAVRTIGFLLHPAADTDQLLQTSLC